MANPFIPNGDAALLSFAKAFAGGIASAPSAYAMSPPEADSIVQAVEAYEAAFKVANNPQTRTQSTVNIKDTRRNAMRDFIRVNANIIRANQGIDDALKIAIGIPPRKTNLTRRKCPGTSPVLSFVAATPGKHTINFMDSISMEKKKPFGAVRLELFRMLTDPVEPPPTSYDEDATGSVYVRSFTRNPISLDWPKPASPRLVTYFARWADSTGEVGPFSLALPTTIVGGKGAIAAMHADSAGEQVQLKRAA